MKIRQSVSKWCFPKVTLEELCVFCRDHGVTAVDLLGPADFPTLQKLGMTCPMVNQPHIPPHDGIYIGSIGHAFNRLEYHDTLVDAYERHIPIVAGAGFKNLICFSGNRNGIDDRTGLENCAAGIGRLIPACEKYGVTLVMELLNSKVDHRDYMCDHTAWGVELCQKVGSEHFKLLYDIYHMQIMEGDVISTIRTAAPYIAHYHTAGVPGRHELDDSQELNYPAIIRAILETGYQGFIAHEFIPSSSDPLASLEEAFALCARVT